MFFPIKINIKKALGEIKELFKKNEFIIVSEKIHDTYIEIGFTTGNNSNENKMCITPHYISLFCSVSIYLAKNKTLEDFLVLLNYLNTVESCKFMTKGDINEFEIADEENRLIPVLLSIEIYEWSKASLSFAFYHFDCSEKTLFEHLNKSGIAGLPEFNIKKE